MKLFKGKLFLESSILVRSKLLSANKLLSLLREPINELASLQLILALKSKIPNTTDLFKQYVRPASEAICSTM